MAISPSTKALIALLLLACSADAALFYAAKALSARDYSRIADPQLRAAYCMVSNTSIAEKYLLAETAARSPDSEVSSVVMFHALRGEHTEQKRAAIRALRERDELRLGAIRTSFRIADYCGYRQVAWPAGVTPLDINIKWLRHDSTFSFFLERIGSAPDAAERVYNALGGPKARARGTDF